MAYIPHYLHLHQNPKQGTQYIGRYLAYGYKHKINAVGWYEAAECNIAVSIAQAERLFAELMGAKASVYVDNPIVPIWEGYVERVQWEIGGVTLTRSMENMQNRVQVTYYNEGVNATEQLSAAYDNTASQALYSVHEASIHGNINYSVDTTLRESLRDTRGSIYSYPQTSMVFNSGGASVFKIYLKGWTHVFDWEQYYSTTTTVVSANDALFYAVAGAGTRPSSAGVYYSTNGRLRTVNSAFQMSRESTNGQTYWEYIQQIIEAGDGSNRWIGGLAPIDYNFDTLPVFYYRQANETVEYITRALTEPGIFRSRYGGRIIKPWDVRPDRKVRVSDVLPFWIDEGDTDPREIYIEGLEYDAEAQTVSIQSGDNMTLDGAFRFNRYFRKVGKPIGPPPPFTIL